MSGFRFLGHALFVVGVATASQAAAARFGDSGVTSSSKAIPPLLMVQYSDRGRDLPTGTTGTDTVRMMIEPVDSKIAKGTAAIGITKEVPDSSSEWATLGLRLGVPTGKP